MITAKNLVEPVGMPMELGIKSQQLKLAQKQQALLGMSL